MKKIKKLIKNIDIGIEELILLFLIVVSLFEFFGYLHANLDFIKKIMSWTILGSLLYRSSLSKILFGHKQKLIDISLVASYFFLTINKLTSIMHTTYIEQLEQNEYILLRPLLKIVAENIKSIDYVFFMIGTIAIFLLAVYMAIRFKIKSPSFMHLIHEEGPAPKGFIKGSIRFIAILLVFVGFYVIFFNLFMEWIAFAVDSTLILMAVLLYVFVIHKHGSKFNPEALIYKVSDFGEDFFGRFVRMFQMKSKVLLGMSGMLVLHLLTDVANFIIPYVTGISKGYYLEQLGMADHTPIVKLVALDFPKIVPVYEKLGLLVMYGLNIICIITLLTMPALLWYLMYQHKKIKIHNSYLALFFTSFTAFLLMPAFKLRAISTEGIVGTDIITQSLVDGSFYLESFMIAAFISFAVGIIVLYISGHHRVKVFLELSIIAIILFWFCRYIYYYLLTYSAYYLSSIVLFFKNFMLIPGVMMLLFFTITMAFYISGIVIFFIEVLRRRNIRSITKRDELRG